MVLWIGFTSVDRVGNLLVCLYIFFFIVLIVVLLAIIYRAAMGYRRKADGQEFLMEIIGFGDAGTEAKLYFEERLTIDQIELIFHQTIPRLCEKHPEVIKVLLSQCIASLEGDEVVYDALIDFQKKIEGSLSDT